MFVSKSTKFSSDFLRLINIQNDNGFHIFSKHNETYFWVTDLIFWWQFCLRFIFFFLPLLRFLSLTCYGQHQISELYTWNDYSWHYFTSCNALTIFFLPDDDDDDGRMTIRQLTINTRGTIVLHEITKRGSSENNQDYVNKFGTIDSNQPRRIKLKISKW